MKIEEFIEATKEAKRNNAEHAYTNFNEIVVFINTQTSKEELEQFLTDMYQVALLIRKELDNKDDHTNSVIMASQCMLRNRKVILKLLETPEMEIKFI